MAAFEAAVLERTKQLNRLFEDQVKKLNEYQQLDRLGEVPLGHRRPARILLHVGGAAFSRVHCARPRKSLKTKVHRSSQPSQFSYSLRRLRISLPECKHCKH